jgi:hypothetical protein
VEYSPGTVVDFLLLDANASTVKRSKLMVFVVLVSVIVV